MSRLDRWIIAALWLPLCLLQSRQPGLLCWGWSSPLVGGRWQQQQRPKWTPLSMQRIRPMQVSRLHASETPSEGSDAATNNGSDSSQSYLSSSSSTTSQSQPPSATTMQSAATSSPEPVVSASASENASTNASTNIDAHVDDEADQSAMSASQELKLKEVEEMMRRAKQLREEALAMENELKSRQTTDRKSQAGAVDAMIKRIFPVNATAINVAGMMRKERWSSKQALLVVDRLHHHYVAAWSGPDESPSPQVLSIQNIDELRSKANNFDEFKFIYECITKLTDAAGILDSDTENEHINRNLRWEGRVVPAIQARLRELKQAEDASWSRKMAAAIRSMVLGQATGNQTGSINDQDATAAAATTGIAEGGIDATAATDNDPLASALSALSSASIAGSLERVVFISLWVPSSLLPYYATSNCSNLGPAEYKQIRDHVLLGSRFYVTSSASIPGAAIFRGNMRAPVQAVLDMSPPQSSNRDNTQNGIIDEQNDNKQLTIDTSNHTAMVFEDIQSRLRRQGLADRIALFLVPDPEWDAFSDDDEGDDTSADARKGPRPVIIAFSKDIVPDDTKIQRAWWKTGVRKMAYPVSIATTFAYAVTCYALNPLFLESIFMKNDVRALTTCMPVFMGVVGIQVIHEAAHYFMAKLRKIKLGRPIPIPSPQLGLFGCVTPLKSFPRNRAALLDLALVGPAASAMTSVACILLGIFASVRASGAAIERFPVLPAVTLKSSLFVGSLLSWLAPKVMMLPAAQPVPIHPLFVVGFSGLVSSALNLLPIFRLDGGRASSAAMGERQNGAISAAALLLLLSTALSEGSGLAAVWFLSVLAFQHRPEVPARDEVTEIDGTRMSLWLGSLVFAISVLLPFPGAVGRM